MCTVNTVISGSLTNETADAERRVDVINDMVSDVKGGGLRDTPDPVWGCRAVG